MVRPLTSFPARLPLPRPRPEAGPGPLRPASHAESALVSGILKGTYPPGAELPAERQLSEALGVTRPTLREALQRLARDGWVDIRHGRSTRVVDVLSDGGLNVLGGLVAHGEALPDGFVERLLEVRLAMAPAYARAAVARDAPSVAAGLSGAKALEDEPSSYASFDWGLHRLLTGASGNFVWRLILNGFRGFYEEMARLYFSSPEAREASRAYYAALLSAARRGDAAAAERVTRNVMARSLDLWRVAGGNGTGAASRPRRRARTVGGAG